MTQDPGPPPPDHGPPPPDHGPPPPRKRLYRSTTDRMLGGVCGGLADYLGMDTTVVRLIAVATILLPGPSVVLYLIAWVIVPESPPAAPGDPVRVPGH